jgi:hypothetical protein
VVAGGQGCVVAVHEHLASFAARRQRRMRDEELQCTVRPAREQPLNQRGSIGEAVDLAQ